ncbi:hypothetical protein [Saccharicrinis aurantiacus]|uniref:hypothetical protein n=1 Tax=Saccharicrinis aurantiacus TaxID=1849719 RepID=UPI00094FB5A7|nr:hypothetical protein [Saccharicrinis aurantiacus]
MKNLEIKTPSEFYRMRRPEYFSDSKVTYDVVLTREVLAYELEKISTNQKQDLFEGFCRRIAEKVIAPNLIPQTGPTGGGDGKTDAETFPVSEEISDRWFIPENGWNKDEKWAFAISAKKVWKPKAESDIKNILLTEREYTRVYFMSNQTISSKQRKDAQDKFIEKYEVDIVILDGVWLLEEVFKNNFIDIAVDSLNLSNVYKNRTVVNGANDIQRINLLEELEEKIQNPNRYSEFDYQKVEDALEAAILARKIERPREEVEGKFDRATRFCKKLNFNRHWIRLHYQKAWTYLYYYDDYSSFIDEFKSFKEYISEKSSSDEIELYTNLFSSLRGFCASNCKLEDYQISLDDEKKELYSILEKVTLDKTRPNTALKAEIDLSIQTLMDSCRVESSTDKLFQKLQVDLAKTVGMIEFPFESYNQIFEELGNLFPNSSEYDKLLDLIASIAEKRSSELSSGKIFLQRGGQKYTKNYIKESLVYFGKAVLKLAKDETEYELSLALRSLGYAFNNLGLFWASNNCFVSANFIAFKLWHQQGKLDYHTFECTKQLAVNELLIGRIPAFLTWYELLSVISSQIEIDESKEEIPTFEMLDAFLSVRLSNIDKGEKSLSFLPDVLEQHNLWLSQNALLFKLGYADNILDDYKQININSLSDLHKHFEIVANQPFRNQMIHETDFVSESEISIQSKVLGCSFKYIMERDVELLLAAETFAAFFENYLSTSIMELLPNTEEIVIKLVKNNGVKLFDFTASDSGSEYIIEINKFSFPRESFSGLWEKMVDFSSRIISNNFFSNDIMGHLDNLFKHEEIHERLSFVYEHRNFTKNVLGDNPKLFFNEWSSNKKEYPLKGQELVKFKIEEREKNNSEINESSLNLSRHDENKIVSIIQVKFWDQAKWKGFGPFYAPHIGFGIFLAFENGIAGKSIFDEWIKRYGKEDINDIIKITIVKGVNKNNPYWYKVHISANVHTQSLKSRERYMSVAARFHQMTPNNSENMQKIEQMVSLKKKFLFCPAEIANNGKIEPYFDRAITKSSIEIRNAWELEINDPESVVILKEDDPIIPPEIVNAPVLEILKKKKQ